MISCQVYLFRCFDNDSNILASRCCCLDTGPMLFDIGPVTYQHEILAFVQSTQMQVFRADMLPGQYREALARYLGSNNDLLEY